MAIGAPISVSQAQLYARAGLVSHEAQTDGSSAWTVTDIGKVLLPKPASTKQMWQQQQAIPSAYPDVGQPGSAANLTFIRAFQSVGRDPTKALAVARAVFGAR